MGFKKNLEKLMREPTEMRVEELCNILIKSGYRLKNINGSHYQFEHKKSLKITFPCHQGKVKKYYLKNIKRIIMPLLSVDL
jgi:predicted RNA binding protein YcfA (HicA-like mRNA interferase family)